MTSQGKRQKKQQHQPYQGGGLITASSHPVELELHHHASPSIQSMRQLQQTGNLYGPTTTLTAASVTAAANAAVAAGTLIRKPCNCKNSKCMKLYCECFASGLMCLPGVCNCQNCCNNPANEELRNEAISTTIEKNPAAFKPKIAPTVALANAGLTPKASATSTTPVVDDGVVSKMHSKGCSCKKSHCLKKYCECFQAGVLCGEFCRCQECKNFGGSQERSILEAKGQAPPIKSHAANAYSHSHSHHRAKATPPHTTNIEQQSLITQSSTDGIVPPVPQHASAAPPRPLTTRQKMEEQINSFVPSSTSHPLSGLLTPIGPLVTRHLLESAQSEMVVHHELVRHSAANDLLLLLAAQPEEEKTQLKLPTPPPASPMTSIALNPVRKALGSMFGPDIATKSPPILPSLPLSMSLHALPMPLSSPTTTTTTSMTPPLSSALSSAPYLHIPRPASHHSPSLHASAPSNSSSSSLLSTMLQAEEQRSRSTQTQAALSTSATSASQHATDSISTKRKREDESASMHDVGESKLNDEQIEKRIKLERANAAVAATASSPMIRPSSPHTASMMCDETDLNLHEPHQLQPQQHDHHHHHHHHHEPPTSFGSQSDNNLTAMTIEPTLAAVPAVVTALPPLHTSSPDVSPESQLYRQQEQAVLTSFVGVMQQLVDKTTAAGLAMPISMHLPQSIE